MKRQTRGRFRMANQLDTEPGTEAGAVVIPLYREAATPPNMTPLPAHSYAAAPPPVTVPYGWRMELTAAGWVMRHDPAEWSVIARCVEGRRTGRPLQVIADELHAEGAPIWNEGKRSYGVPRWHPERVRRLVARYDPDAQASGRGGHRPRGRGAVAVLDQDENAEFESLLAMAEQEEAEETQSR